MHDRHLELLIIRHGESWGNRDGSGGIDCDLTDLGVEQARRLTTWLSENGPFVAVYSSPMARARKTAELAMDGLGYPIVFEDDLAEVEFELRDILPQYGSPIDALLSDSTRVEDLPQKYGAFCERVKRVFAQILERHPCGRVLIFAHGGVIATLLRIVFGAHQVSVYADNTAALLLRWQNSRWYLVYSNCTDHLKSSPPLSGSTR